MKEILKDIDAVLFDMDGTLIDSMWIWMAVDEEYLKKFELKEPENFRSDIEGMSFMETAQYYHKTFPALGMTVDEIMKVWHDMAYDKYMHEVSLKKGARDFIAAVRAQGIKTGIATSNARKLVEDTLKSLGVADLFDMVKTSDEAGAGKPAPDVYLHAARELCVPVEKCLVFEDIPAGILAGKRAGMRVCAVEDGFSADLTDKKRKLADYYIQDYDDIKNGTYEVL